MRARCAALGLLLGLFFSPVILSGETRDNPGKDVQSVRNLRSRTDLSSRIAIIGGGISGITAAYELQKKGYKDITLYEAESRIGGKVKTVTVDGHTIELGAVLALGDATAMFNMGRDLGVTKFSPFKPNLFVVTRDEKGNSKKVNVRDFWHYWGESSKLAVLRGIIHFSKIVWLSQFKSVFRPGFYNIHSDLVRLTTLEFAKKYGFDAILDPVYSVLYATGYGGLDEIPALYHLKLMKSFLEARITWGTTFGFNPGFYACDDGFQKFLEGILSRLEKRGLSTRLGSRVDRVVRKLNSDGDTEILVTTGGKTATYGVLYVTVAPDQIPKFMDVTAEERELFGRATWLNYHTVVFRVEGLPDKEWVMMRYNMSHDRDGHLFSYYNNDPGSNLFTGYQVDPKSKSNEELDRALKRDIAELGGNVTEIVIREPWKYFPHVSHDKLDEGYYPRLNALQGQNGTFYLGSLLALENTGPCAQFAEFVVDNYSVAPRSPRSAQSGVTAVSP